MSTLPFLHLTACAIAACCSIMAAQPEVHAEASELVQVDAILEHTGIRPGETTWVGVRFQIKDGWHTYWPGQNDTGLGTTIEATAPKGLLIGDTVWPAPKRYPLPGGILDHVHTGCVMALVPVTAKPDAELGMTLEAVFDVSFLVCNDVCIPGDATVSVRIPVIENPEPVTGPVAQAFSTTRQRIPEPMSAAQEMLTVEWTGADLILRARGAASLAFYPAHDSARVADLLNSGMAKSDSLHLTIIGEKPRVHGVLEVFGWEGRSRLFRVRTTPPSPSK